MVRAPFYDKNGQKKGAWSSEEDERLIAFVQRYGHSNWRQLPKFAGLARCGKSCRLRWLNYLRPNLKHGNYTKEEEETIIKLHQELGNRWSQIAEKLPGRTDNEIKNYWHSHLKKFLNRNEITTSSESKSKSGDTPEDKTTNHQFTESEGPGSDDGANFLHVLESSLPMPSTETSYIGGQNYSLISNAEQSTLNSPRSNEDCDVPSVTFEGFNGDFWTEPFILENTYTDNEIISGEDVGFLVPYFYEDTDFCFNL